MAQTNWWDKYERASQPASPIVGPAPDPAKQAAEARAQAGEVRAQQDQVIQLEKLQMEREKAARETTAAGATEAERTAGFLSKRIVDATGRLSTAGNADPSALSPTLGVEAVRGVLGDTAANYLTYPERQQVRAAQIDILDAALTLGTGAAYTKEQIEGYREAYFPKLGDDPDTIKSKQTALISLLESAKIKAGRAAPDIEAAMASLQGLGEKKNPPEFAPTLSPPDEQMQANESGFRNEDDPALSGVKAAYMQMLEQSIEPGQGITRLREMGITDPEVLRTAGQQLYHRRKYPQTPLGDYNIEKIDDRTVPLSGFEKAVTGAGANPVGAYFLNAGQFLSGNTLDNLSADPDRARAVLETTNAMNPNAAAVGQVSGGIMSALAGEAALARAGVASGLGRSVLADAAMGGASSAGAADAPGQNRFVEGLKGAGAGAAGAVVGNAALRAIGPTGGSSARLYEAGVNPTLGQRVADKGVVGRMVNTTEQALQSVPVVGSAIKGARQEARDQFQLGAFNEALGEIGDTLPKGIKPGTDPHAYAQKSFERVYDEARGGMQMMPDQGFGDDLTRLNETIATLGPKGRGQVKGIIQNNVNNRFINGVIEGEGYKKAISGLGKHIARFGKSSAPEDQSVAEVLRGVRDALENAARRHSDPDAVALLDKADAGYAKLVRIEEAAQRRGGDAGAFSPANFDASVQKTSGGVRSKAYLRGDALMQDYAKAGRSLEDTLPNSGTVDRALVGGGAAAAGYLEPTTLTVLGAIGTLYAPGARKIMQKAIAPAGPKRRAIADRLKKIRLLEATAAASAAAGVQGTVPDQ